MMKLLLRKFIPTLVSCLLAFSFSGVAQEDDDKWPKRVLITNDDGIQETRIWELAKAFSKAAETYLIASLEDRSGTSNFSKIGKNNRSLFVQRDYLGENLIAYAVAGYPADCVTFGLKGLLRDKLPDLVVSGINGGANLGDDAWFNSGTIGAARTAAFLGYPAIAVSGLDDDDEEMVELVTDWVVQFAQSKIVQTLESGQYLTVSIPRTNPSDIKGIKIVSRTHPLLDFDFEKVWEKTEADDDETEEVWLLHEKGLKEPPSENSDVAWYQKGYIVIVPMRVNENDAAMVNKLKNISEAIPAWPVKETKLKN